MNIFSANEFEIKKDDIREIFDIKRKSNDKMQWLLLSEEDIVGSEHWESVKALDKKAKALLEGLSEDFYIKTSLVNIYNAVSMFGEQAFIRCLEACEIKVV